MASNNGDYYAALLRDSASRAQQLRESLGRILSRDATKRTGSLRLGTAATPEYRRAVSRSLRAVSPSIAASHEQVLADLSALNRTSWAGTAHELREAVTWLLRILALDESVVSQDWYKQDRQSEGPTLRQRVRYIRQEPRSSSKLENVAREYDLVDQSIEKPVRAVYSRASDSAQGEKDRDEVVRVLNHFHAFAADLIDVRKRFESRAEGR